MKHFLTSPRLPLGLIALILVAVCVFTCTFLEGGSDSSIFRYVGWRMANGGMCYADAWDHKGPIVFLINAIGFWLLPIKNYGPAVIFVLVWFLTGCFIYLAFKDKLSRVSLAWGIFFALYSASFVYGGQFQNNVEICATLFASLAFLVNEKLQNLKGRFLVGFCVGCAFMVKPNLVAFGAAIVFGDWMRDLFVQERRIYFVKSGFVAASGLAVCMLFVSVFFLPDNLYRLWDATFLFNFLEYHSEQSLSWLQWWWNFLKLYNPFLPGHWFLPLLALGIPFAIFGFIVLRKEQCRVAWILLLWFAFEIALACCSKVYYNHYLIGSIFPFSILIIVSVVYGFQNKNIVLRAAPVMYLLLAFVLFSLCARSGFIFSYQAQKKRLTTHAKIAEHLSPYSFVALWGGQQTAEISTVAKLQTSQSYCFLKLHYLFAGEARKLEMEREFLEALIDEKTDYLLSEVPIETLKTKTLAFNDVLVSELSQFNLCETLPMGIFLYKKVRSF